MKTKLPEPRGTLQLFTGKGFYEIEYVDGFTEAQLKAAMVAAYNEAIENVIGMLESGSFLHEDAPAARMVRAAVPAIRTLKETP